MKEYTKGKDNQCHTLSTNPKLHKQATMPFFFIDNRCTTYNSLNTAQLTKADVIDYIKYNGLSISPVNKENIEAYIMDERKDKEHRLCLKKTWNHNNQYIIDINIEGTENIDGVEVPPLNMNIASGTGVGAMGYMDVHYERKAYFQTEYSRNGPYQEDQPRYYRRFATSALAGGDAEVKLLSLINTSLEQLCGGDYANITGLIVIKITKGPCSSCRQVIRQFHHDYPKITLVIRYNQREAQMQDLSSHSGLLGFEGAENKGGFFEKKIIAT